MIVNRFITVSLRRRLIDEDLLESLKLLSGQVMDLGGGQTRGIFAHGKVFGWVVVDEDVKLKPSAAADAHTLPFKNSSFDAVKCSELTGYLMQPLKMLKQVRRVLKPGGMAVFTAPFLTPFDKAQHDGIRLTSAWWKWAAGEAGFKIVKIKAQGYLLTVLADYMRYWVRHWWWPFRYLGYLIIFPLTEIAFWWENNKKVPVYFKRFSTGFLVILKKTA